uniref:Transmembrane protein 14C n=2 Tax=Oryctolagus cuniculus TaxID=9986 RepID=G1TBH6_RABIT
MRFRLLAAQAWELRREPVGLLRWPRPGSILGQSSCFLSLGRGPSSGPKPRPQAPVCLSDADRGAARVPPQVPNPALAATSGPKPRPQAPVCLWDADRGAARATPRVPPQVPNPALAATSGPKPRPQAPVCLWDADRGAARATPRVPPQVSNNHSPRLPALSPALKLLSISGTQTVEQLLPRPVPRFTACVPSSCSPGLRESGSGAGQPSSPAWTEDKGTMGKDTGPLVPLHYFGFGYAALVATGGIIGYAKAGSVPSLAAGLLFGSLAGLGAYQLSQDPRNVWVFLATSGTLAGIMGMRFYHSGKFMPAGLIAGASLLMVAKVGISMLDRPHQ